ITLYDSSDTVITSGTSGFAGWFAPGTYYVTYTLPNGTLFSPSGPDNDVDAGGRTANFTLISGSSENIGAGVYQPVTFMGRMWRDLNANGIQDGGEPDQPGLTVQLWYSPGAQVGSFTTLADGSYSFANILPARSYEVRFGLPGGYHFSQPNQGGDDALDSDAATATGIAGPVTPTAGSTVDLDAGTYQDVVFSGRVWHDQNANGIQDGGEPGLGGMGVDLHTSVGVLNTSTLADGSYTFTVTPGNGSIFFNLTAGYYFSPQNAGGDDTVDSDANPSTGAGGSAFLTSGQTIDFDAGAYQYASVGDRFWHDLDGDGIQDGGEPGGVNNPGVTSVNLYTSGGSLVSSFTPDASGSYSFTNVTPGSYYFSVNWGPITELHTSPPNQGGNDNQDSDLESLTQTAIFALTSGQNTTAYDFGFWFSTAIAIGDPWNDLNSDGVKDAGEPDLPGISTISLYDSSDNLLWSGASGIYYWGNIGTFYVTYSLPNGYVFSPLGTDNDVDASGRTANFTLNSTQSIGIQAGMYMP
ncbi:MAG: hypothetical protein HY866_10155, partial [Chloroflexi bacterium]|nr:hypothetical protein [Chloroflexota bacterium]